jgi:hypothetical protein
MSIKLTDTQILMLSAAAQRDDRCLVAPRNLKGGAAQKVAAKLIGAGLVKEVKAKPEASVWRQDEQAGQSFALKLMAAGIRAVAADDSSASDATREGSGERERVVAPDSKIVQRAIAEAPATGPQASPRPEAARARSKISAGSTTRRPSRGSRLRLISPSSVRRTTRGSASIRNGSSGGPTARSAMRRTRRRNTRIS